MRTSDFDDIVTDNEDASLFKKADEGTAPAATAAALLPPLLSISSLLQEGLWTGDGDKLLRRRSDSLISSDDVHRIRSTCS